MTNSVEHQRTDLYGFVDEFLQRHPTVAQGRRSPHAPPQFSDAEVVRLALLQGVFAVATLKQSYRVVARNWREAFPTLPTSKQGVARLHHLGPQMGRALATPGGHALSAARLYLLASKPIPLGTPIRHGRVRLLREEGATCGKPSTGGFFGFTLPRLRPIHGRVLNIVLTPGHFDDRDPAPALVALLGGGVVLGDLGYRGPECATAVAAEAGRLLRPRDQAPEQRFLLRQVRHAIATTFRQLGRLFVDRVFSRSWHGLWNTIQLKVLFYHLVHAGVVPI